MFVGRRETDMGMEIYCMKQMNYVLNAHKFVGFYKERCKMFSVLCVCVSLKASCSQCSALYSPEGNDHYFKKYINIFFLQI
jgi:hypothetical protein